MSLRGHPLQDRDFKEGNILTVSWKPEASYHWDTGAAIGHYLAELKKGKLTGVVCDHCARTVIPPRYSCEVCFRPMSRFQELPDTGTINTFSMTWVRWDRVKLEEPIIPAVIEIDGTTPRVGILHLLGGPALKGIKPEGIKIGMKVKAVWKKPSEREGAITDIRYFAKYD